MKNQRGTMRATIAYPFHDKDGGALLPTSQGKLICARCHFVDQNPPYAVLARALAAHESAGEGPLTLGKRPPPEALGVADLTQGERKSMRSIHAGRVAYLSENSVAPLVSLGLVVVELYPVLRLEVTEHGKRLARLCADAEAQGSADTLLMFDLGPPDMGAAARVDRRRRCR